MYFYTGVLLVGRLLLGSQSPIQIRGENAESTIATVLKQTRYSNSGGGGKVGERRLEQRMGDRRGLE